MSTYRIEHYLKNKEKIRGYQKKYYSKPEAKKLRALKCARYYKKHKEKCEITKKKWRDNNRVKVNLFRSKWRRNMKLKCIEYYGGKCHCCGESTFQFLTLDHINNDGAEHRKAKRGRYDLWTWVHSHKYPDFIKLSCFNCNLGRELSENKICPHQQLTL